jgi:hypothetical protein
MPSHFARSLEICAFQARRDPPAYPLPARMRSSGRCGDTSRRRPIVGQTDGCANIRLAGRSIGRHLCRCHDHPSPSPRGCNAHGSCHCGAADLLGGRGSRRNHRLRCPAPYGRAWRGVRSAAWWLVSRLEILKTLQDRLVVAIGGTSGAVSETLAPARAGHLDIHRSSTIFSGRPASATRRGALIAVDNHG